MSGALGVSTISYAPWALFNIFNPLVAVAYAITGFRVERLPAVDDSDGGDSTLDVATEGPPSINDALRDDEPAD